VEVSTIEAVWPHPNADRLDIVKVKGWECVTGRGNFKVGDTCIYIPIDSVLPPEREALLFPEGSKVKLTKSRVKTVKIRGCVSQGMCVKPIDMGVWQTLKVGQDLAGELRITKYEPPRKAATGTNVLRKVKGHDNPYFRKYTDLENIKNYPDVIKPGELVVVTEKIHGTNFRAGWVPYVAHTWWQKLKAWAGFAPEWEFVFGSRNVQLQTRGKIFYDTDVYSEAVAKYDLKNKIPRGFVVFGEIYGSGIQPGYDYGCAPGEHKLVLFDIEHVYGNTTGYPGYLEHADAVNCLAGFGLPMVPTVYEGPHDPNLVKLLATGPSVLAPSQAVREGVVVRTASHAGGRKILKVINDAYLLSKHADEEVAHDQVTEVA